MSPINALRTMPPEAEGGPEVVIKAYWSVPVLRTSGYDRFSSLMG